MITKLGENAAINVLTVANEAPLIIRGLVPYLSTKAPAGIIEIVRPISWLVTA